MGRGRRNTPARSSAFTVRAPPGTTKSCAARVTRLDVWRTTYFHPLAGSAAVVEWFKGSGLRPYLEPLNEGERGEFLARYQAGIAAAYPAFPDGTVLLPFPRLFIVATR